MKSFKKFKFSMPHVFTMLFGILVVLGILSLILSYAKVGFTETKTETETLNIEFSDSFGKHNSVSNVEKVVEAKKAEVSDFSSKSKTERDSLLAKWQNTAIRKELKSSFELFEKQKKAIVAFLEKEDQEIKAFNAKYKENEKKIDVKEKLQYLLLWHKVMQASDSTSKELSSSTFLVKSIWETSFADLNKIYQSFVNSLSQLSLTSRAVSSGTVSDFFTKIDKYIHLFGITDSIHVFVFYMRLADYKEITEVKNSNFLQIQKVDKADQAIVSSTTESTLSAKANNTVAKKYTNTYEVKTPILGSGILDWFTAIPFGIKDAFWIIIFLFVLGGFINVVIKSQALEALIGKISTKFHADYKDIKYEDFVVNKSTGTGMVKSSSFTTNVKYYWACLQEAVRQTWVIIPLMLFFSFAGTTYGMAEESLAFYAIIIPLALAAGFDVYTGFLIIFVGAGVGVMGSTINPFSILTAVNATKDAGVDSLKASDGAAWRWIGWVFFTLITIAFVMWYAAKVKKDKNKSYLKDLFEIHQQTFQQAKTGSLAPVLTKRRLATAIIFMFTFVFMVFAMLNYDAMATVKDAPFENAEADVFGDKAGTSWFHNSVVTTKMGDWTFWVFGNWYFESLSAYFVIVSLVIAAINWRGEKAYMTDMTEGAKDMMGVALAVGVARAISVLLQHTNMQKYFVKELSAIIKDSKGDKNVTIPLLSYIIFIPLTFVIPSTSGLANAAFPILGPAVDTAAPEAVSGTITAYGWAAGWANMLVPTYGVVIGALAVAKIPYNKFLSAIWKYLLMMFLAGFFMIVIGGAAGSSVF